MDNLPVEVVTHIFKFLSSLGDRKACSLVCRLWYDAYQDPVFRNLEELHITSDDRFQVLVELKNESRKFLHLVVKEIEISESSLKFWERFGPNIKSLSIFSCDIREKMFVKLLKYCKQLESLGVQNCRELFMVGTLLEDENDRSILRDKLKSVTSLNLSYNRYLSDAIFVKFVLTLPNLKELLLAGCQISFFLGLYKKYYPNGQTIPSESVLTFPIILEYIKHNAKRLKFLSFNDTFIDNEAICYLSQVEGLILTSLHLRGCFQLSQEGIIIMACIQKDLTELDISLCPRVTDICLLSICSELKHLKSLYLQRCMGITDLGIAGVGKLEKLESLNIAECDSIEGEGLILGLCSRINENFKELRMSYLRNVGDHVIVQLSRHLPNLRVLDLGFCYNGVTDMSMQSILENNLHLQTLILTMCEKLTDSGLTGAGLGLASTVTSGEIKRNPHIPLGGKAEMEIVREAMLMQKVQQLYGTFSDFSGFSLKNLVRLRYLNLTGCNGISDLSLIYAFQLKELRHLNLSHCNEITEEGLEFLCRNNRAIESLNLELCRNVNNEGVRHVVENLKRLEAFIIGSNKITDIAAELIAEHAKYLTYLDIRHCNQISSIAIDRIIKRLPNLQNFHFFSSKYDQGQVPVPPEPIGLWSYQNK